MEVGEVRWGLGLVLCSGILMVVYGELDLVLRSSRVVLHEGVAPWSEWWRGCYQLPLDLITEVRGLTSKLSVFALRRFFRQRCWYDHVASCLNTVQ